MKKKGITNKIGLLTALIILSVFVVVPFIWMFFSSFKSISEFYIQPPRILPENFILDNYTQLLAKGNFLRYYWNSIVVSSIQVIAGILIVMAAGYGFAKYNFRGKKFIFTSLLATTMVPWIVTIIPLYIMTYKMGLVDTYLGLIFPGLADAFNILLVRNFMSSIPTALIEAARIDGAGEFKIFRTVVLPLTKPVIAVVAITKFIGSWNAFQWPLMVVGKDSLRTLPLAIAKFSSQYNDAYNLKIAAACLAIIPVLIIYAAFQKYFVSGISLSGVKE